MEERVHESMDMLLALSDHTYMLYLNYYALYTETL